MKEFESVKRTGIDTYKWDYARREHNNPDLLPFWVADSDYKTAPCIIDALIERTKNGTFGYTYSSDRYYKTVSDWFKNNFDYYVRPDMIAVTGGVVNALYLLVKLFTKDGDSITVNPPVYNPFYSVIENNNRNILKSKVKRVELDETFFTYQFDFKDLEEKISKSKIFILCNPHNPVGRCYTMDELGKIVSICKKYNCMLVSDEIHCDLYMEDAVVNSVGKFFNEYNNIVICTAPSKTFNVAGLSNSNIFFNNEEVYKLFTKELDNLSLENCIYGQVACEAAYTKGLDWVKKQRHHLTMNRNKVYEFVKANKLKVAKLEGTYLMWIDISMLKIKQEDIYQELINYNILVNMGTIYDEASTGIIRFNIACSTEQLEKGLEYLKKFIYKYR